MTIELLVQIDLHDDVEVHPTASALSRAVYRAIEYVMDNGVSGTASLNRVDVGQITVKPLEKNHEHT